MVDALRRSSIVVAAILVIAVPRPSEGRSQEPGVPRLTVDPATVAQLLRERETPLTPAAPAPSLAVSSPKSGARIQRAILGSLYASHVALQAMDFHTTARGLRLGAVEANPLLRSVVRNPAALAAIKAGAITGVVLISEKLWKKSRLAALVFMGTANSILAFVVRHNIRVIGL